MIEPNTKEQALERLNFAVRDAVHARRYVFGMPLEPANQNWVRDIEALAYVEKVLLESSGDRPTPPIPPACGQGPQYDAASYQLLAGVRRELSGIKYRPDVKLPDRLGDIPSANEPIQIVFDGPPAPESGRFVEVEQGGKGINFGEWKQREDGYWVLELPLAPPAQTTDGTLTFKMPQATTAPPEPGEEEGRGALKILDDYFGGATFDSAIFGTDDGGPIDEAREKLQKSWDCLRSLILAPATAAAAPPAITSVEQFGQILFFDCISKPSSAPERNCEQCDHSVECDESCKGIEALILAPPAAPVRVTRGEVVAMLMTASGHIGIETSRVDDGVRWLREKGIIVEEGEEKP